MPLLSPHNPEKVTLIPGVSEVDADRSGSIYILVGPTSRSPVLGRANYGSFDNIATVPNAKFQLKTTDIFMFAEPAAPGADALWIGSAAKLRRHQLNADGTLQLPDRVVVASVFTETAFTPTEFRVDRGILYARDTSVASVRAFNLATLARMPTLDFALLTSASGWDVKTLEGSRKVAYIGAKGDSVAVYYDGSEVFDDFTSIDFTGDGANWTPSQLQLNVIATLEPFIILTGRNRSGSFLSATVDSAGEVVLSSDTLQSRLSSGTLRSVAFTQKDRTETDTLNIGEVASVDALARLLSNETAQLTRAEQRSANVSVFREIRETTVEVEITGNIDRDFLLNGDWHFKHKGLIYSMSESTMSEEGVITASFTVKAG